MLIPKNIAPSECIYYKAAFVIKALQSRKQPTLSELYYDVNTRCKMTFLVFTLCLDWLYLIGCIRYTDNTTHRITLCI